MEVSKIDLNTIKTGAKNIAARGVEEATNLGNFVKKTAVSKAQDFDKFTSKKISTALEKAKINSDTVLGAGVGVAAIALAVKCLKGIIKKAADIKNK